MEPKKLIVTASPHLVDTSSTRGLMLNVIIALCPALIASALLFGMRALVVTAISVAACVGFEALWCAARKQPLSTGDLSAVVTGIILAFNLPATIPWWAVLVGAFIAIIIIKQLFGGLGMNFANPALVGRIALFLGFSTRMTDYGYPARVSVDAFASATPLAAGVPGL